MAGYSGTPLPQKLGIRAGAAVAVVGAPPDFDEVLGSLPDGVTLRRRLGPDLDVTIAFFTKAGDLGRRLPALERSIFPNGGLWVAWPKRSSGVSSDITEDSIRDLALPRGLVDNKVCAIDDTWSGLRLVWRRERRG